MPSQVAIANRALSRLGSERILTLDQASTAARAIKDAWVMVRDEVLRAHSWNCVTKRASISELSTTPSFGYQHHYQLPTDCMRVLEVLSGDGETPTSYPWVVESRLLLTDESAPLRIRYVRREEDTTKYDPLLASCIAARLALELAEELTQSNAKIQTAQVWYQSLLLSARKADGEEQSVMPFVEDEWVTSRF